MIKVKQLEIISGINLQSTTEPWTHPLVKKEFVWFPQWKPSLDSITTELQIPYLLLF